MKPILNYSVREVSVDLLVLEEFYSSEEFQSWFLHKTYGTNKIIGNLLRVDHSSIELERESDILLVFQGEIGEYRVLIENKINAQFQPNQAEDYKKRALGYIERGECQECITVLLAPKSYISSAKGLYVFDHYISYEEVIDFFRTQIQLGERKNYKIDILNKAIKKSTGKLAVEDPVITRFWLDFWEDITQSVPQLVLEKPGSKSSASTFIFFRNKMPNKVNLVYKFVHGFVDIQVNGKGEYIDKVRQIYQDYLAPSITIERSGKSVLFRISVPKVNPHLDYSSNETAVKEAQRELLYIYDWFNEHLHLWKCI